MARRISSRRAFMSVTVDSKECLLRSEDKAARIWGWLSWSIHHACLSCHFRHWRDFVFPVEKVLKTVLYESRKSDCEVKDILGAVVVGSLVDRKREYCCWVSRGLI
jgi:hypothetical protein